MSNPIDTITVGFIGGGRVTRILLEGRCRADAWPARLVVSDPDEATLTRLKLRFPRVEVRHNGNQEAASQDVVFLAIHPPAFPEVAGLIGASLKPQAIVVSLAPSITMATLSGLLGGFQRIVRMIPNAPALMNVGFNPIAFSPTLTDGEKLRIAQLGACWGCCPQVIEDKLEAFAILTGMGPTYFWPQLYELQSLALSFGLTTAEAQLGLQRLFVGLIKTMAESGLGQDELKDLVPVRPMADVEPTLLAAYRTQLNAVMQRIKAH